MGDQEMKTAKCGDCGSPNVKKEKENYRYTECGLDNVVLEDLTVHRCQACGAVAIDIPRIEVLHQTIARTVAAQPERLSPKEIRFLRKWLGLSGADFANKIGADRSTVSRWENVDNPQAMGLASERLLRLMVMTGTPADSYPIEQTATTEAKHGRIMLAETKQGWVPHAA